MNQEVVKRVQNLVPPFSVVKDFGRRIHRERSGGRTVFWTPHPSFPESRLYITKTEFVEPDKSGLFWAGTPIDYLTAICKGSTTKAIDLFFQKYGERVQGISNYEKSYTKEFLAAEILRTRAGFRFLTTLLPNYHHLERFHGPVEWLRSHASGAGHQSLSHLVHWGYLSRGDQTRAFLQELYGDPKRFPFDVEDRDAHWVVPYFNRWSNISHLRFERPERGESHVVPLNPAALSFAGLHSGSLWTPDPEVLVTNSPRDAITLSSWLRSSLSDQLCLLPDIRTEFNETDLLSLGKVTALISPGASLRTMSRISRESLSFSVLPFQNFQAAGEPETWASYLTRHAAEILEEDGVESPRLQALLASVQLEGEETQALLEGLACHGIQPALIDELKGKLNPGQVYRFKAATITETPHGYLSEDSKTMQKSLLTNFTLDLQYSTILNAKDVRMVGEVLLGDIRFPFSIRKTETATWKGIEDAVLTAFNRWNRDRDRAAGDQLVPVVCTPELGRLLPGILAQKGASAPYRAGFSSYGWAGEGHFIAPSWERRDLFLERGTPLVLLDDGPVSRSICTHPFSGIDGTPEGAETLVKDPATRRALHSLVLWLVRGSLDFPVQPLLLEDSVNSRNLVKALVLPFGQAAIPTVQPNARRATLEKLLPGLIRFPFAVSTSDPKPFLEMGAPLLLLAREGLSTETRWDRPGLQRLVVVVWHLINRVLDWISLSGRDTQISFSSDAKGQEAELYQILGSMLRHFPEDAVVKTLGGERFTNQLIRMLMCTEPSDLPNLFQYDRDRDLYMMLWKVMGIKHVTLPNWVAAGLGLKPEGGTPGAPKAYPIGGDLFRQALQDAGVSFTPDPYGTRHKGKKDREIDLLDPSWAMQK